MVIMTIKNDKNLHNFFSVYLLFMSDSIFILVDSM